MDSASDTPIEHTPGEDNPEEVANAEQQLAAAQAAQDQRPPAQPKVAPPRQDNAPPEAPAADMPQPPRARNHPPELDVLGAHVEGMAVTLRDLARVALAAAVLAVIALLVALYVLRALHGLQSA